MSDRHKYVYPKIDGTDTHTQEAVKDVIEALGPDIGIGGSSTIITKHLYESYGNVLDYANGKVVTKVQCEAGFNDDGILYINSNTNITKPATVAIEIHDKETNKLLCSSSSHIYQYLSAGVASTSCFVPANTKLKFYTTTGTVFLFIPFKKESIIANNFNITENEVIVGTYNNELLYRKCWLRVPYTTKGTITPIDISDMDIKSIIHCYCSRRWNGELNGSTNFRLGVYIENKKIQSIITSNQTTVSAGTMDIYLKYTKNAS